MLSMSWNADGTCLLTGGECLTLWEATSAALQVLEEEEEKEEEAMGSEETVGEQERKEEKLEVAWQCPMPNLVTHLKFAPSGTFFASCGEVSLRDLDYLEHREKLKCWYLAEHFSKYRLLWFELVLFDIFNYMTFS